MTRRSSSGSTSRRSRRRGPSPAWRAHRGRLARPLHLGVPGGVGGLPPRAAGAGAPGGGAPDALLPGLARAQHAPGAPDSVARGAADAAAADRARPGAEQTAAARAVWLALARVTL